jgi:hypothetical protein
MRSSGTLRSAEWYFQNLLTLEDGPDRLFRNVSTELKASWPLKMGPIGCSETSAQNCHYTLPTIPEERRSIDIAVESWNDA